MSSRPEKSINNDDYFKQIIKNIPQVNGNYLPNIFPLGYFVKRSEPRLLYVMPISMIYEGKTFTLKSKNISPHGLQVFMPRTFIQEGKTVKITFDKFIQTQHSVVGGEFEFAIFADIDYLIKDVHHLGEKTYISLIQINLSRLTSDYIDRFIAGNRLRYKIDASDRICASKAQYYENLYTVNMQQVPMFIHWNQEQGFYIDTLIKTRRNVRFFNYFSHLGLFDFSPFCLPQRIKKFAQMARSNQSAIMFTYWHNEQLYSVFDFELPSIEALAHIVCKVKICKGRIYKTLTNLNKKPAAEKITAMLSKIQRIDAIASKIIDKRASQSIAQVVFTDITQIFSRQTVFEHALEFDNGSSTPLTVINKQQRERMADGHVTEVFHHSNLTIPEIIDFNIDYHRYDPRYQYEMTISIKYNQRVFTARTLDFSRSGLGLVITQKAEIPEGAVIEITFSSLLIKGISTQLKDIQHRVMISRKKNDGLFLGVIRDTQSCDNSVNRFFTHLVKRNKEKLKLCVKDKIDSVITTFYEAFVTENIQTIPIVITRDRLNQHYVRDIGLTESPCELAKKLYIEGHGYDFRFLTSELRLNEFHQRALKATDKNTQSFMIFLFKYINDDGLSSIFSIADFELSNNQQMEQLVHTILKSNGSCIQIKFMNNLLIDKLYRNMTLDMVEKLNKSSVKLLAQEYKEIIGFAEMLDLTDEYKKLYQLY